MDRQQLFLQNSLAKAAGLLFQAGELLKNGPSQCLLQMEITIFMSETKKSLFELLSQEPPHKATSGESAQSAPIAGSAGQSWTSPPEKSALNTPSPAGPVVGAGTPTTPPEASGASSAGGTTEHPPTSDKPQPLFPLLSSAGNSSPGARKSSAFLSLTYHNGKKLLVAKDSIANILQADDGCFIFYKGSPENPDSVMESFSYIEKELL